MMRNENAVSPVVGVMLMLVVTIIIAAVVSAFAGGLTGGTESAPQLSMDVSIRNTGYAASSYMLFDVQAVSDPIPTSDLKITTVWSKMDGTKGGATVTSGLNYPNTDYSSYSYQSPLGFGTGVSDDLERQMTSGQYPAEQQFGNFMLVPGTTMKTSPQGYGSSYGYGATEAYNYTVGSGWADGDVDGMMALLGDNWNELRPGDLVDVMIVHIPSGKIILDSTVAVEG